MRRALKKGFTLLEVLLYIAITATMLGGLVTFITLLTQARIKDQTITEVTGSGIQLLQFITQAIHNASGVSVINPYTLLISDALGNQSTITLADATVKLQANQTTAPLTSNQIIVDNLVFTPINGKTLTIQIGLTLQHSNPSQRAESSFTQTWYATAALRP